MTHAAAQITSRQNPLVARFRALARGEVDGRILLDGIHLLADALAAGLRIDQAVVAAEARERPDCASLLDRLREAAVPVVSASPDVMKAVSPVRSPSPIVAEADRPRTDERSVYAAALPLVIVVADVQDPGNVGAIIRAAEAGGATAVVTTSGSADPFGWKALRGSMGSALRLPVATGTAAGSEVAVARRHGCRIVAAVPSRGTPMCDVSLRGPVAVLIGGEGPGLAARDIALADDRLTIPMAPRVESLNAATAAALIVYEARRQRERGA